MKTIFLFLILTTLTSAQSELLTLFGDETDNNLIIDGGFNNGTVLEGGAGWFIHATFTSKINIADGKANFNDTADDYAPLLQDLSTVLQAGHYYELTFEITDYTSGILNPYLGNDGGTGRNSVGVFTETIQYTTPQGTWGTSLEFFCWGSFVGSIDNVTLIEVSAP